MRQQGIVHACLGTGLAVTLGLWANRASAASGQLDPSFGHGGVVITHLGQDARPLDAVLQSNGDLVVVGGRNDFRIASTVALLARYHPDGTLDPLFGQGGTATDAPSSFDNEAEAIALQADGKLVILERATAVNGWTDEFRLVRFDAAGRRDASFGIDGRVLINIPHPANFTTPVRSLVLQRDQRLVIAGSIVAPRRDHTPPKTVLGRYLPDGTPDPSFGREGIAAQPALPQTIAALAVLSSGDYLAADISERIAQFSAAGRLRMHATGGAAVSASHPGTFVFRPDGALLVAAGGRGPSGRRDSDVRVHLTLPDGTVDPAFQSPLFDYGSGGPYANLAQAIAIGPTGEYAVAGFSQTPTFSDDLGVARLSSDGHLDATFGHGGTQTTALAHGGQALAVLVQPDGKIVAIGQAFSNDTTIPVDLALVRYLTQ